MHDTDAAHSGKKGAINELLDSTGSLVNSLPDHVDLGGYVVVFSAQRDADASGTCSSNGIRSGAGDDTGHVIARDSHLHRADSDFERVVIQVAQDLRVAPQRTETHRVPDNDILHDVRAGIAIPFVGTGCVGNHGRVELLAELAP